jgi:hypothetical protein
LAADAGAQFLVLAPEARILQRALERHQQAVGLERLFDEIEGAALDGVDRRSRCCRGR